MEDIQLVFPNTEHQRAAEDYKEEFFQNGETVINGSALFDQMEFDEWLQNTRDNQHPETVRPDWVVASTFFAVRSRGNRILGMIDIRHSLDNEFLSRYGGHIGYSVRPSERRKGIASEMLRQALDYARSIGLSRVMLGCYTENLASIRTIEKCGGRLSEVKPYLDGQMMNVYWISLEPNGLSAII